jgi:hypothetical protein
LRDDGSVGMTKTPSTPGRLQEGLFAAINAMAEKEKISFKELMARLYRLTVVYPRAYQNEPLKSCQLERVSDCTSIF